MGKKYITLKEASEMSGYSSDYIGQLVRRGKIEGKQVYANVAWMTTEKAVRKYARKMELQKKYGDGGKETAMEKLAAWKNRMLFYTNVTKMVEATLYIIIGALIMMLVVLFYAFSINLDRLLHERALQDIEQMREEEDVLPSEPDMVDGVPIL